MANHGAAPMSTPRARNGEPQPAPPQTASASTAAEPASTKRDLTSWWKQFKRGNPRKEEEKEPIPQGIFGVPLDRSITYANVAISLFNEGGESYIYGYVPIVVAKCGVFLKEKATDIEGIFRLAGSEKRIKELKAQFDTPDRYGKGLDWTGYTVHDAANILRRYFNQLPEPIIPLDFYERFRQPLRNHQAEAVGAMDGQAPSTGGFDVTGAIRIYQLLIKDLPPLNRQLLLYILDLLAVFAAKADVNKMTTSNLAAIFQPGILSHPSHDMSPNEYRLSQDVLIFLIENQDHFLIGMEGTAVDEGTVKHIESGASTPQARTPTTPARVKSTGLGRSASTASAVSASAGADNVKRYGGVRRNMSVSSRGSRHSGVAPSPVTPSFATPTSASGVHRSNTVPSNRSPALTPARFSREKHSDPATPTESSGITSVPEKAVVAAPAPQVQQAPEPAPVPAPAPAPASVQQAPTHAQEAPTHAQQAPTHIQQAPTHIHQAPTHIHQAPTHVQQAPVPAPAPIQPSTTLPHSESRPSAIVSPPSSEDVTPTPPAVSEARSMLMLAPETQAPRHISHSPARERSEFVEGPLDSPKTPTFESMPGTARTFTQILKNRPSPQSAEERKAEDRKFEERKVEEKKRPNKLQKKGRVPSSANPSAHSSTHSLSGHTMTMDQPPSPLPPGMSSSYHSAYSGDPFYTSHQEPNPSRTSGSTLKPTASPSPSFNSHSTAAEYSEGDDTGALNSEKREKKRWHMHKRDESKSTVTPTASQTTFGSVVGAEKSMSSFNSSNQGRRSLQMDNNQYGQSPPEPSTLPASSSTEPIGSSRDGEKKGLFNRFREKMHERKEEKQRLKSPPGSTVDLPASGQTLGRPMDPMPVRGKSMDVPRDSKQERQVESQPQAAPPAAPPVVEQRHGPAPAPPAQAQPSPSAAQHQPVPGVPFEQGATSANAQT
ncbi:RhoGAP-domain-containing protein [Lophium mytilinum]|uniref:RhoGAP-domain-containing protein n=1 Tax=Lophium mytilinum TaxID=390894 RepID=A0A6A6QEG6_9PEZI|nr:RhoGAP-domain-containing protein [Lophium mytilinum]